MSMPQRVVIVHKGALGDFLQVWPSLAALAETWPDRRLAWAGREAYLQWIEPLGIARATPAELLARDRLYAAAAWPEALEGSLVLWFGLQQPPTEANFSRFWFLPGLEAQGWRPPREVYAQSLRGKGVGLCPLRPGRFRALFGRPRQRGRGEAPRLLLFPGAGHPAKCWPREGYLELGAALSSRGARVAFVLGPAEVERGLEVQDFERLFPQDLQELHVLLQEADLVIGNDSGPLHLSSALGVPTLALFGPTSPQQWGPQGARIIWDPPECSPCTRLGRIACPRPHCLSDLDLGRVLAAVREMVPELWA